MGKLADAKRSKTCPIEWEWAFHGLHPPVVTLRVSVTVCLQMQVS